MDIICSSWFIYPLGSLLAGLFGWLLRDYFAKRKLSELHASQESTSAMINKLTADHVKTKNEDDAKVESLQNELTRLKRTNHTEKEELQKKWKQSESTLHKQLDTLQEENSVLKQHVESLKATDNSDNLASSAEVDRLNEELNALKKKHLKVKDKYKKLEKQHLKSQKSAVKKASTSKDQTVLREVPVEITKRVEVQETVDFKKLKKLLTSKLPTIKKTKVTGVTKKKGKPKIVKPKSEKS